MLTVILTSHNGERTLPAVLEAYLTLQAPAGGWKLVVADNASTDSTANIVDRFAARLPLVRLHVAARGKNRALNAALAERAGDLIVFTDDDAIPAADWLIQMRRGADLHGTFDIFGGAITPKWERTPESWLLEWVPKDITYSLTDESRQDGPVSAALVWGPNMAVRARLFDHGAKFDESIGPGNGVSYAMGGETEFTIRMEQQGYMAFFLRQAVVVHTIRDYQMRRAWVLGRATRFGRGSFRRDRLRSNAPSPRLLYGMPRWLLLSIVSGSLRWLVSRLIGDEKSAFEQAWALHRDYGYLAEARRCARAG